MAKRGSSSGSWIVVALVVLALSQCFKATDSGTPSNTAARQPTVYTSPAPRSIAPAAPVAPSPSTSGTQVRYVTASTLNVRSGPSTGSDVIGKLQTGQQVTVIGREGDWLFVEAGAGQGWVSGQYTSTSLPAAPTPTPPPAPQPPTVANVDRSGVVQQIIERSIRSYSGNCPCPYNTDRAGRRCGQRSAYSKPGGRSPICYREQVTAAMIDAFLGL